MVLFFRTVRKSDGKRVENKIPIGLLKDFSSKSCAWAEVERQHLFHSLASFLVRIRTDPKTVQTLLRHSDVKLTLQCYTHSVSEDRMAAAGAMLTPIFSHAADRSGLKAD